MCSWYRPEADRLTLYQRVTPRAGVDRIEVRLCVRAVPDKGRANEAVIALLSQAFGLPKSSIRVTAGETARLKTVSIEGDAAALAERAAGLGADGGRGS